MAKRKAAAATEPEVDTKVAKKSGNSAAKKSSPAAEKKPAKRSTKNEEAKTTKAAKASPSKAQPKSPKATQNGINSKSKTKAVASKSPAKKTAAASPKKAKTIKVAIKKTAKSPPKSVVAVKTKKPSPRSKVASPKQSKSVPKSAAPAKKKAASKTSKAPSKAKKAENKTENEESEMEVDEEKPVASNSAAPRKRVLKEKPEKKEVKPPKKPKIEVAKIHVPFRQVRGEGNVLTFGQGDVGQLGLGEDVLEKSRPALVAGVENVVDVHAGGMHTVCLTGKGEIYTFGCNDEGALGRDTTKEGSEFNAGLVQLPGKAVQISAGDSHTAAVLEDGRVFVWGSFRDSHGTMGLTSTGPEKLPVQILSDVPIVKVASGADHLVCLAHDGTVYTCGCAEQGQLGRVAGLFTNRGGRQGIRLLLTPQPVPFGRGKKKIIIDDIWTGSYCTFARAKETGLVYVFGLNNYNQLGVEENDVKFAPLLAESFIGRKWLSISCGQHHTLALDEEGKVYSLGRKDYGRLGLGPDTQDVAVPTLVTELKDHKIFDIAAGESVSFAVSEKGDLFSWGMGTNGQLGQGNEDDLFVPAQVKGKQLEGKRVLAVSAGGQHTVVLAKKSEEPATATTDKPEAKENGQ